jgi:signal transduction histidine kinase/ActR/RegA family two-component response regulator
VPVGTRRTVLPLKSEAFVPGVVCAAKYRGGVRAAWSAAATSITDAAARLRHDASVTDSSTPRRRTIHPLRDALLAASLTFFTSAIGLSIVYVKARDAQLQAVRGELLQLARTTAAQVDGDLHRTLVSAAQMDSPEHLRALAPLVRMHRVAKDVLYVYTAVLRAGHVYWVLDTTTQFRVPGNEEPADPIMTEYTGTDPDLMRAFREQIAVANTQPIVEPDQTYLSAFAPIYDRAGQFVALLCVDMTLDALEARMAVIRWPFIMALLAVLLLSVVAGAVALRFRQFAAAIVHKLREARAQAEKGAADAQAATRAKASFLAMMSHEIRTPMNGILGVADLLRHMSPDPQQKKLLKILAGSGASLLSIINDILDFSKIEAERLELRPRPFELRGLLDELEHLLGPQARAKQVAFVIDADPTLPAAVNGDRQRISQVLLNLVTNAVKFTDRGEVHLILRVFVTTPGQARIEFTVRDSGIGMDAEAVGRLFTPFTQVAESHRHRGGGTGLGLVIAQKLVGLMGGSIRVQSEPAKGSTFSFTVELPVAEAVGATTTIMVLRLETLSVLVAEDNAVNQTIISAMLRHLGHTATLAATGRQALDALAREDFDLVLMDCNMPVMDGMEATRLLRAGNAGARDARIPVIALTANAMEGDREMCLAAGMDEFLPKPVTIAALRKTIELVRESARAA